MIALPKRPAALVASEVAQFDHLRWGSLMLSIGAGGLASDMELFDALDGPYRTERMMEPIDTIPKLWRQDRP